MLNTIKCAGLPKAGSAQSLYCSGVQTVEVPIWNNVNVKPITYLSTTGGKMIFTSQAKSEFIPGMWTILQLQFSSRYRVSQSMRHAVMLYVEKNSESIGVDLQSPQGCGRYWSWKSKQHMFSLSTSAHRITPNNRKETKAQCTAE